MNSYMKRMESNLHKKEVIMQFIDPKLAIVDVGSSSGYFTRLLSETFPRNGIIALEPEPGAFYELSKHAQYYDNIECIQGYFDKDFTTGIRNPVNLVFASVMHEIYSYNQHFHVGSCLEDRVTYLRNWLTDVFSPVPVGSRAIIRDGIRPYNDKRTIKFIAKNMVVFDLCLGFLLQFMKWNPFAGAMPNRDNLTIVGPAWLIFEMMFTITWAYSHIEKMDVPNLAGPEVTECMDRECAEHFTILSNNDYMQIFEDAGFDVTYSQCFVQDGYPEYFARLGDISTLNDFPLPCPFTTQLILAEKLETRLRDMKHFL